MRLDTKLPSKEVAIEITDSVVVNLRARSTWACVSHLPEVVLHVSGQDSSLGQSKLEPDVLAVLERC